MKVKYNLDNDELFCVWCKERITIGEKYIVAPEEIYDETVVLKTYHVECLPEMEDDE